MWGGSDSRRWAGRLWTSNNPIAPDRAGHGRPRAAGWVNAMLPTFRLTHRHLIEGNTHDCSEGLVHHWCEPRDGY